MQNWLIFSLRIFLKDFILIEISQNLVPLSPTDSKLAFVSGNGLSLNKRQGVNWTSDALVYLVYIDGLAQDCSISIANALEMLQSCNKPSIYALPNLNELMIHDWDKRSSQFPPFVIFSDRIIKTLITC